MMTDVTRILNTIEQGDSGAADELLPLIYEELRILASQKLSHEKPGRPKLKMYETRSVSGRDPFKLGITASKRLVIFSEFGKKRKLAWRSPIQN